VKILLLCRSLGLGGTERQIVVLAKSLYQLRYEVAVAVFYRNGPLEKELREIGVRFLICASPRAGMCCLSLFGW